MTQTLEKTDTLILAAASDHHTKIAVIISKVYDAFEAQGLELTKDLAQTIAARIYILIDNGALECQGNMRRWREADVKLPATKGPAKMKTLSCDLCDTSFEAETFEDWFKQMQPHYMSDHADIMKEAANKSKEEGMKWMDDNRKRFEAA